MLYGVVRVKRSGKEMDLVMEMQANCLNGFARQVYNQFPDVIAIDYFLGMNPDGKWGPYMRWRKIADGSWEHCDGILENAVGSEAWEPASFLKNN